MCSSDLRALEVFPDLTNQITSEQVQVIVNSGFPYPQWFTVPENRISRGVYHFPSPVQSIIETDDEICIRIKDTYESIETLVRSVASNTVNSLIISGAPGLGKSYTVNKILSENSRYHYTFHRGYLKASHLFRLLWENKEPNQTIVLDDTDSIFSDETALNLQIGRAHV